MSSRATLTTNISVAVMTSAGRIQLAVPAIRIASIAPPPTAATISARSIVVALVISAISYRPHAPSTAMNTEKAFGGRKRIAPRTRGSVTAAVRTLVLSTQPMAVVDRAEAAIAGLVRGERFQELALAEVGPQRVGEI